MNKIFFLKMLIGFLTFLIFLTLLGILYGIINYDKTPKLFSKNKSSATAVVKTNAHVKEFSLNRPRAKMNNAFGCGKSLCLKLVENGNDIIAVISPEDPQKVSFIFVGPVATDQSVNR